MASTNYNKCLLNIIQWNAHSLRPKLSDFKLLLNTEKVHIAIISESWLQTGSDLNISQYHVYRKDRIDAYGGVAIITHKSLKTMLGSINIPNCDIEVVHVKILNSSVLKNVLSVYCPSNINTSQAHWDYLFSMFSKNTIIAGDFNGHHTCWSDKVDTRGNQLFDSSLENGFVSINNGNPTRVKLVNGSLQQSSPDITFCSSDIASNVHWRVTNESLGSDHLMIKVSINYEETIHFTEKRNYCKANWKEYKIVLTHIFANTTFESNILQERYNWFVEQLNIAGEKNIPLIRYCNNIQRTFVPKSYWNQDLSKIVAERRLALKNLRRNPIPDNLTILERKISEARKFITAADCNYWQSYWNSIDENTNSVDMWHKMQWIKGLRRARPCNSDEKKQELLFSLSPDYVSVNKPLFHSKNDCLQQDFTFCELENALKKKNSSPGHDGISYSMLFNLPDNAKLYLLDIFNLVLKTGYIPFQWRLVEVIAIPKPGQPAIARRG